MKYLWLIPLLALTACAGAQRPETSPVRYTDYRASLVDYMERAADPGLPPEVIKVYAECSATYLVTSMDQADRARLDAYARQKAQISPVEGREIEGRMNATVGGPLTAGNLDRLNGTCPDQVPMLKRYLGS